VPPESYGNLLQHFTGSKHHNLALRERAVKDGLSVSEYSITVVETGEELTYADEADVYERLGYQFIPPELRENAGELEAARKGELPQLVELTQIKGDLHSHTTYSDGRDSLEQMALAARERGYAYLAVTDHPRGSLAAAGSRHRRAQRTAEAVQAAEGHRGEHPHRRLALATG
jgi:DNA polymerase (family 10)